MQRFPKFPLSVKTGSSKLPAAEPPSVVQDLKGHNGKVYRVVALPESGLIATACRAVDEGASSALRIFSLDGDGEPLHTIGFAFGYSCGLAAVGGGVVACGGKGGWIMTCRASEGGRLETLQLENRSEVTAIASVGDSMFVAGCYDGALLSLAHSGGRNLRVVAQYKSVHSNFIRDVARRGDVVVTASGDKTAAVRCAATHERLPVLSGHGDGVSCTAMCDRFIATGSNDKSIRIYENKGSYSLDRVLERLHTYPVRHVEFVGEDMLMSASRDETLAFSSLSTGNPMARVDVGFVILSVAILPDGRLACVGGGSGAFILNPPALVADAVKRHAETLFPSSLVLSMAENEPLQAAMIEVCAGRLSAGDACRNLVTKENCSRSAQEWWSAHRLLMAAVDSGEVVGELHFEGELYYWFEYLYTPSRHLPLGNEDWKIVKRCASEAQAAGVIEVSEAVLASVLGGQDLLREVSRLEAAGQRMLFMLSQILVEQAETDEKMKMMGKELARLARAQKVNALLGTVFSFAPLGGAAAANAIGAAAEALPLAIESIVSAGVGIQGAATPALLDKFVFRAESMSSVEGWKRVTPENRVAVREAAEGLGMSWKSFCGMVQDAAAARRDVKTGGDGDGTWKAADSGGSEQAPSGEKIALVQDASISELSNCGLARSSDGDGDGEVSGTQTSAAAGSTSATASHGLTPDNSGIEIRSTLSRLDMNDGEGLHRMEELKAAPGIYKNLCP